MDSVKNFGPVIVAAIALIVSMLSYRIARRNERRSIDKNKPLITAKVFPVKDQPQWFHIYWSVENREEHNCKCNFIEFRKPWSARGLSKQDAFVPKDDDKPWAPSNEMRDPLPIDRAKRRVETNFTLARAGVSAHGPFPGSTHWESTYVYVWRWSWPRRLSMRVSLSSIDIHEREMIFTVRRKIPAVINDSTAAVK